MSERIQPMYTQCPQCFTVFSLDARVLAPARGLVTCGYCQVVFDALEYLTEQLPPEPFQQLLPVIESTRAPQVERAISRPPITAPCLDTESAISAQSMSGPPRRPEIAPRFIARQQQQRRRRLWLLAVAGLLLAGSLQLTWLARDRLIAGRISGSWLRQACATLHCQLPLVRAPQRLRLLARDMRSATDGNNALILSLTLRNSAPFGQPYPVLAIRLKDSRGQPVAMRRLRPAEYLNDPAIRRRGIAAGADVAMLVELRDPSQQATLFDLSFE